MADWLYWKPYSEGYEFSYFNQQNFATDIATDTHKFYVNPTVLNIDFDFNSNYRLIGGSYLSSALLDIILKFTHVHGYSRGEKTSVSIVPTSDPGIFGTQIYRVWTLGSDTNGKTGVVEANKSIRYLAGDIEFGKIVWGQDITSLRVQIGVRGIDLKNILRIRFLENPSLVPNYSFSGVSDMEIKNQFKGAGLRVGTGINFKLHKSFFWQNEFNGALVLGKFKAMQSEVYSGSLVDTFVAPSATANTHLNQMSIKSNIQLSTSLGYTFTGYKNEISLKVGYEVDYWPNMNQLTRFVGIGNRTDSNGDFFYAREKGDVYFHGIYGEAGISF